MQHFTCDWCGEEMDETNRVKMTCDVRSPVASSFIRRYDLCHGCFSSVHNVITKKGKESADATAIAPGTCIPIS